MFSGLNPAGDQFLASLNDLQGRIQKAQNEISTGIRVNKASDAPQDIVDIFQSRADVSRINQVDQNLTVVKAQVDTADSTVQTAITLLENAAVLGTQGATATTTSDQRAALATQVQSLISELVGLTNTKVSGVFIFSGDASGSAPYQVNTSSATGVDRLVNTQATQQLQDPTGIRSSSRSRLRSCSTSGTPAITSSQETRLPPCTTCKWRFRMAIPPRSVRPSTMCMPPARM